MQFVAQELFSTEATTAVIAAHCLLAVVSRYWCFHRVRSDRGAHFVNEVVEEFLQLFEIQAAPSVGREERSRGTSERFC